MVGHAAEGKEDVWNVNAEQGLSHTELLIFGDSNKRVYVTTRITEINGTKLHYNYSFRFSLTGKTHPLIQEHAEFPETSLKNFKLIAQLKICI